MMIKWKKASPVRSDFTLIEMLTVLAIAGILIFVALPAFEKLATGQGVSLAGRVIGGKLKAARSYAVTKRKYVAVLFPHISTDAASTIKMEKMPDNYPFRAYRACIVTKSGSTYTFQRWIEGEKWHFTPQNTGIVAINQDSDLSNLTFSGLAPVEQFGEYTVIYNCPENKTGGTVYDVRGIVFKPNGRTNAGSSPYRIILGEGKFNNGVFNCTNKDNLLRISINGYTGRISFVDE